MTLYLIMGGMVCIDGVHIQYTNNEIEAHSFFISNAFFNSASVLLSFFMN